MNTIRILLVDDHAIVREGLKALISTQPGLEVIGEASEGTGALDLSARLDPDVVVTDLSMPGLSGAQLTAKLQEQTPGRKVLALTVHEDPAYLRQMLDMGASGYVLKRAAAVELIQAIRAVAAGGIYLDPALAGGVVNRFVRPAAGEEGPFPELSERETAVVRLIALGYSNKEIAIRLDLSVKTVETYKARSIEKLGLRSRVEIVQYAVKQGWLGGA